MAVEINDNKQNITSSAVKAILEIVFNRTKDKLDTSAFSSVSGDFATHTELQDYQPTSSMSNYVSTADFVNSASWNSAYETLTANSGYWDSSTATLSNNSGAWNETTNQFSVYSGGWEETRNKVGPSADFWNDTRETVNLNSGTWGTWSGVSGDYATTSQLNDKEDKINYGYITIN